MKKRKGTCKLCMKCPRVLSRYYLTNEWMCAKCEKAARAAYRRGWMLKELEKYKAVSIAEVDESELARLLAIYGSIHRYVKDVFEFLTGFRPHRASITDEDIDLIVRALAPQTNLCERIAALQCKYSADAYTSMERCSKRKREDPYAFLFLGEHKTPLDRDGDFGEVEKVLRMKYGDYIPEVPPALSGFSFTHLAPIPLGMCIAIEEVDVAGLEYRRRDARNFCLGSHQRLFARREPDNAHDANAIQVIGNYLHGGVNHVSTLGYLPARVAAELVSRGKDRIARVILNRVWISEEGFVKIVCDVVIPVKSV